MKVFISSVISGMEAYREAAARAVRQLRHEVLRAEDFGASDTSPRVACLDGVRQADAVLLLMGSRYGPPQKSGLSATHEEYLEAKDRCPVLVMVQRDVEREPEQAAFVAEVRDWVDGHYTASFHDPDSLLDAAVGALHTLELAAATGPVDAEEMLERACALLPHESRSQYSGGAHLALALAGGPRQAILRPAQLDDQALRDDLQQLGMFGSTAVLNRHDSTEINVKDDALVFDQNSQSFSVGEDGSVLVLSAFRTNEYSMSAIIEEDVQDSIQRSLLFADAVLERIDPTHKLSHCVPTVTILGAEYGGWRTRAEDAASPNSMAMNIADGVARTPVSLTPPHRTRAAIRRNAGELAEDLMVKLRRELLNPKRQPW